MSHAGSIYSENDATFRISDVALAERPFLGVGLKMDTEALQNWESDGGASSQSNEELVNATRKVAQTQHKSVR